MWKQCLCALFFNVVPCHGTQSRRTSHIAQPHAHRAAAHTTQKTHPLDPTSSCWTVWPSADPGRWHLRRRCCCLPPHATEPMSDMMKQTTLATNNHAPARRNFIRFDNVANCGPNALAPSSPMLLSAMTHNNQIVSLETGTPQPHNHAPERSNSVMLTSLANCGPSTFTPSASMLLSAT